MQSGLGAGPALANQDVLCSAIPRFSWPLMVRI